jgi:transposase
VIILLLGGDGMTAISNEKREILVEAKKRGETEKNIAKWLKISERSVTTIWRLYRESGSYLPLPYLGRKPILSPGKWEETKAFVNKNPDKTLDEIIEELKLPIHKSRLSVLLIGAGYSLKKRLLIPPSKTEKMSKKSVKILQKR